MKKLLSRLSSILLISSIALLNLQTSFAGTGNSPALLSPSPNSTLTGSTATLTWSNEGATCYDVAVGKYTTPDAAGGTDYKWIGCTTATTATVNNLPTDGSKINIRLFSHFGGTLATANDFQLTSSGGTASSSLNGKSPTLLSPAPNSTLTSDTVTLNWSDEGATCYDVAIGKYTTQNSAGATDYKWIGCTTATTATVNKLPTDGSKINVRLFSHFGGTLATANDFQLTSAKLTSPTTPTTDPTTPTTKAPTLLSPTPSSTLTSSSANLTWSNQSATSYSLVIVDKEKKYGPFSTTNTSYTINNLPTDGRNLYLSITANFNQTTYTNTYKLVAYKTTTTATTDPSINPITNPITNPANPNPLTPVTTSTISAVWANDGGDKVNQDEHRATTNPTSVYNDDWNGSKISTFGAKNEVVDFNLILEANNQGAQNISVNFNTLTGPNGSTITSTPPTDLSTGLFDWTNRDIELFYVRYLQIKGLSLLSYENYDERHIPEKLRRPYTGEGFGTGSWTDRPNHDKYYPDIAVPLELKPTFDIAANQNQSIWSDIYIPKTATPGLYTGTVQITENGATTYNIPVELTVHNFSLPDTPNSKTMVFYSQENVNKRFFGTADLNPGTPEYAAAQNIRDQFFKLAHRNKISLVDSDPAANDGPSAEWLPRLTGGLFTAANGYRGPGESTGNNVYSIGQYGSWNWKNKGESGMRTNADAWVKWFSANSPLTEYFLYLIDESNNYPQIEQWASWIKNNPGVGNKLKSFATIDFPNATTQTPSLSIAASWFTVGSTTVWQNALNGIKSATNKEFFSYNGKRPANGSFATEDDGVALRELPWSQYKKGVSRWYFWESTYYDNNQGGQGETNVFQTAQTFGGAPTFDDVLGQTGWNYSNGDGVLFYPGTDKMFPADSYNIAGPIASIRLKEWRRGIQDVDYITLAAAKNPGKVAQIVASMVPKALWVYGVTNPKDPTWVRSNISWSTNPDVWENARAQLTDIIEK